MELVNLNEMRVNSPRSVVDQINKLDLDDVKEIMVAIQYKDNSHSFSWSDMSAPMKLYMVEGFKQVIMKRIFQENRDH